MPAASVSGCCCVPWGRRRAWHWPTSEAVSQRSQAGQAEDSSTRAVRLTHVLCKFWLFLSKAHSQSPSLPTVPPQHGPYRTFWVDTMIAAILGFSICTHQLTAPVYLAGCFHSFLLLQNDCIHPKPFSPRTEILIIFYTGRPYSKFHIPLACSPINNFIWSCCLNYRFDYLSFLGLEILNKDYF